MDFGICILNMKCEKFFQCQWLSNVSLIQTLSRRFFKSVCFHSQLIFFGYILVSGQTTLLHLQSYGVFVYFASPGDGGTKIMKKCGNGKHLWFSERSFTIVTKPWISKKTNSSKVCVFFF